MSTCELAQMTPNTALTTGGLILSEEQLGSACVHVAPVCIVHVVPGCTDKYLWNTIAICVSCTQATNQNRLNLHRKKTFKNPLLSIIGLEGFFTGLFYHKGILDQFYKPLKIKALLLWCWQSLRCSSTSRSHSHVGFSIVMYSSSVLGQLLAFIEIDGLLCCKLFT